MYSLIVVGLAALVLSLLLTPLVRNVFRRWGIVDPPDSVRKLHERPVPSGGGAAVALAYVLSFAVLLSLPLHAVSVVETGLPLIWRLLPSAIVVLGVGFLDDILGLRPWQKLLGQVAAAGGAFWAGIHLSSVVGYHIGIGWNLPLTIGWLIFCTNALNLVDGVDGLATGLGFFAAATMLTAGLLQFNVPLALATAPLVGALLGFLRYNFNPATVFLGDSGSLFIGFLLGCYSVLWSQKSTTILGMTAPLLVLFIPILDSALVMVRRFLRRQPVFSADRGHIHHRLLELGYTPRRVALSLYAVCAVGAVCSIAIMRGRFSGIVIVFGLLVSIGVWRLGYDEFGTAARMLIEGAFRRQLNTRIALHAFEEKLTAAQTPQRCWATIYAAAPDFGLHCNRMSIGGHTFNEPNDFQCARYWTVHISLSKIDRLELTHAFGTTVQADATAPFINVVRRSLPQNLLASMDSRLDTAFQPLIRLGGRSRRSPAYLSTSFSGPTLPPRANFSRTSPPGPSRTVTPSASSREPRDTRTPRIQSRPPFALIDAPHSLSTAASSVVSPPIFLSSSPLLCKLSLVPDLMSYSRSPHLQLSD
jgi:UDP-GlcNAc:undecaprenyl-phosphate GlcNAc-1-phosphate transferase